MLPMTSTEKPILIACASAGLLAFFPWYSISVGGESIAKLMEDTGGSGSGGSNAFGSTEGTLAFVSVLATAGLLMADRADALPWSRRARLMAPVIASAAAFVFMVLFMSAGTTVSMMGISAGRTFWFYVAMAAVVVAAVYSFRRWMDGAQAQESDDAAESSPPGPPAGS